MRFTVVTCVLIFGLCVTCAEHTAEEGASDITKLEVVELDEAETDSDAKESDVQIKRDSGYSYNRVNTRSRFQGGQSGYRGRIVSRVPSQINRPFNKYGPPSHQNSGFSKPAHGQQNRDKFQQHGHSSHQSHRYPSNQHSGNFENHGSSLWDQGIPSPIRNIDFVEPSPIAGQNNEPFGSNTANYLPPKNQKLPGYSPPDSFSPQPVLSISQSHMEAQNANFQNQNIVQSQGSQISDAALFLTQNAQALEQLYGAPATSQEFAPNVNDFVDQNNQLQNPNAQFQSFESTSANPQGFRGPLPSYASGTLNPQETLEHIQSLEKDRLIAQLQQALAQSQIQSPNTQGNVAFNQSPFLPGTTTGPTKFPLGYGLTTTTQSPSTTTTTTTTSTGRPIQGSRGDGTSPVGTNVPAPVQPGTAVVPSIGFPFYGGFVPTFVTGTSPTHFGIPIPTDQGQKPSSGIPQTPQLPPKTPPSSGQPGVTSPPPVHPAHPISPLPVTPLHPVATPVHPVHPILPATPTHVHPPAGSTPSQHPTYGLQTPLINPVLYKPIKPVYPVYYYQNVAYQLQKPTLPTYPWSYAPSYVSAKPAQIWK
ncbi:hypothetical protein KPH14_010291 [Odynerus spinipes]|uniref:Uncharacterized protein n=1 Tax=Odynerus spinipes TaxID=1348599 RepID=A0AAD9VSU2_9HYME|nr:hypothetical protein KPH14_010291 [Odynerus spinipes]